jgi:hypothetical protein
VNPQLEYAGEAICLVGIAFRLLRWAFDAVREGDAAPSDAFNLTVSGTAPPQHVNAALPALTSGGTSVQSQTFWSHTFTLSQSAGGDPECPPEMLAALTPEQREKVLATLAKMRAGQAPD